MTPALVLSKNIFYRNRESEHISNLEDCVRIIISWSELLDSNQWESYASHAFLSGN